MFGDDASKKTCLWLHNLPALTVNIHDVIPPIGFQTVTNAADCDQCDCCDEPYCQKHFCHYADCSCIGPTEDDVIYKNYNDQIIFGTKSNTQKMLWGNQTISGQNKLPPSKDRWKIRSKTYHGIAKAMAEQWG